MVIAYRAFGRIPLSFLPSRQIWPITLNSFKKSLRCTTNLAHHFKFLKKKPALHPSFLGTFMSIRYKYGIKWWYEFNDSQSGIVTFVESKPQHFESMKNRVWLLRDTIVDDELHDYKNLGVLKNYVGSFSSNVEDNIHRTCKKVGLIFASNFDRCKVNLLVYMKLCLGRSFWSFALGVPPPRYSGSYRQHSEASPRKATWTRGTMVNKKVTRV